MEYEGCYAQVAAFGYAKTCSAAIGMRHNLTDAGGHLWACSAQRIRSISPDRSDRTALLGMHHPRCCMSAARLTSQVARQNEVLGRPDRMNLPQERMCDKRDKRTAALVWTSSARSSPPRQQRGARCPPPCLPSMLQPPVRLFCRPRECRPSSFRWDALAASRIPLAMHCCWHRPDSAPPLPRYCSPLPTVAPPLPHWCLTIGPRCNVIVTVTAMLAAHNTDDHSALPYCHCSFASARTDPRSAWETAKLRVTNIPFQLSSGGGVRR